MSFFSTFSDITRNRKQFEQQEQKNADEQAKRDKYFSQHKPSAKEQKEADEFRRVVIDAVNVMDTESENKAESVELAVEQNIGMIDMFASMGALIAAFKHGEKSFKEFSKLDDTRAAMNLLEKKENRAIAESLEENNLIKNLAKDHKGHFYIKKPRIYTKENWTNTTKEAQAFLKNHISDDLIKANKKVKGAVTTLLIAPIAAGFAADAIARIFGTMAQVKASRVARYQARQELKDPKNFVEYTDEQKAQAAKNVDKVKLPKDKNKNGLFSPITDITSILRDYKKYEVETKKLDKITLDAIPENDPEQAYGRQRVINRAIRKINNTAENYSEDIETMSSTLIGCSVLGGAVFGKLADKLFPGGKKELEEAMFGGKKVSTLKKIKLAAAANKTATGVILSTIIAFPIAMMIQKNAARAGRFQAKKDLEKDPNSFIDVSDEKLSKINAEGKVKKDGFLAGIKSIPNSIKIMLDYEKYKKTELKDEKKMMEALKKTDISDDQMKKAQSLQMRLFKSFDTVDDHSQEYGEEMEAVCEIGQQAVQTAQGLTLIGVPLFFIAKPHKALKPLTDLTAGICKKSSKFVKKYVRGLGSHITEKLNTKVIQSYEYEMLMKNKDAVNKYINATDDVAEEALEALKDKMGYSYSDKMAQHIEMAREFKQNPQSVDDTVKVLNIMLSEGKKLASENLAKDTSPADLKKAYNKFFHSIPGTDGAKFEKLSDKNIKKIHTNLKTIVDSIPDEDLGKSLDALGKYTKEDPLKGAMALDRMGRDLGSADKQVLKSYFISKEVKPIIYGIGATFVAGTIAIAYTIENWLTNLQKKAGRLGVESAIKDLNKQNDAFKANNASKPTAQKTLSSKGKTASYFDMLKTKKAQTASA